MFLHTIDTHNAVNVPILNKALSLTAVRGRLVGTHVVQKGVGSPLRRAMPRRTRP
jgi:hypothetical protein